MWWDKKRDILLDNLWKCGNLAEITGSNEEMGICQHWSENNVCHLEFLLSAFRPGAPRINRMEEELVVCELLEKKSKTLLQETAVNNQNS